MPPGPLLNSKAVWVRLYTTLYTGWQITPWIYDWIGRFNNDFGGNALDLPHIIAFQVQLPLALHDLAEIDL
jgi:hypothetical protein